MFSPVNLHPGLIAQYSKLRNMGYVLCGFTILSLCDLIFTIRSNNEAILQWRVAIEPALIMVLVIAPLALYMLVWQRIKAIIKASQVVQTNQSRPMILKTWSKEQEAGRDIFFFELEPEGAFGCVTSSYLLATSSDSNAALPLYCAQSWNAKSPEIGLVNAFVEPYTGLPVAVQTTDALCWVGVDIHLVNPDDKEKILKRSLAN